MADIISKINILDIVIIALTVLLLLFGIWRGMYKMLHGFISSTIALVIAILLTSTVVTFTVDNTQVDEKLVTLAAQPLSKIPNSQQVVAFYDLDSNPDTAEELGFNPGSGPQPYTKLLEGTKFAFLSPIVKPIVNKYVQANGATPFIRALVAVIIAYALSVAAFLILWILFFILVSIIFLILKKVVTATYIGYYLNKVVGGVLGVVISAALIFGFLTIIKLMGNYEQVIPVNRMIEESTVTKLLANKNFLYTLVADKIDVQSLIDKLMAMIAKTGLV
ncbi:MAG: CvpA family protein [Clostridia bacterium]|nr:CvpA family protein [Clostridia bacterium]